MGLSAVARRGPFSVIEYHKVALDARSRAVGDSAHADGLEPFRIYPSLPHGVSYALLIKYPAFSLIKGALRYGDLRPLSYGWKGVRAGLE